MKQLLYPWLIPKSWNASWSLHLFVRNIGNDNETNIISDN